MAKTILLHRIGATWWLADSILELGTANNIGFSTFPGSMASNLASVDLLASPQDEREKNISTAVAGDDKSHSGGFDTDHFITKEWSEQHFRRREKWGPPRHRRK